MAKKSKNIASLDPTMTMVHARYIYEGALQLNNNIKSLITLPSTDLSPYQLMGAVYGQSILSCFAIEVALKSWSISEGHTPKRTHDLLELFSEISPNDQAYINTIYQQITASRTDWDGSKTRHISETIEQHRRNFEKSRYVPSEPGDIPNTQKEALWAAEAILKAHKNRWPPDKF